MAVVLAFWLMYIVSHWSFHSASGMRFFRLLAEFRLFMPGEENQTIFFCTTIEILLIGLLL